MAGIAALFTDSVSVETYRGTKANTGADYASPATDVCFVNEKRNLVRDAQGTEVVSETTLYTALASISLYTPGSRVTIDARKAHVISAQRHEHGPASAHHAQITLT